MPFTGNENHHIELNDAAALTARFRDTVAKDAIIGGYFSRAAIMAILNQADCVGIRYYYGISGTGAPVLVLVGATANMNDQYNGELAEISLPCPTYCAANNPLNSTI